MYLDHTFSALFGLSRYLDRTFARQIGSAKVKSKSEVIHCFMWTYLALLSRDDYRNLNVILIGFIASFLSQVHLFILSATLMVNKDECIISVVYL